MQPKLGKLIRNKVEEVEDGSWVQDQLTDQESPGEVLLPLPLDHVEDRVSLQEPVEAAELERRDPDDFLLLDHRSKSFHLHLHSDKLSISPHGNHPAKSIILRLSQVVRVQINKEESCRSYAVSA